MPRPTVDLTPYKETILGLYEGGATLDEIVTYVNATFSLNASERTIRRRLEDWKDEFEPRRFVTKETPELRARIRELFNNGGYGHARGGGLSDEEILERLEEEGFRLGLSALVRIRKSEGLVRRGKGDAELWEREKERRKAEEQGVSGQGGQGMVALDGTG